MELIVGSLFGFTATAIALAVVLLFYGFDDTPAVEGALKRLKLGKKSAAAFLWMVLIVAFASDAWRWLYKEKELTQQEFADLVAQKVGPFNSKVEFKLNHAHDECGPSDCFYRIDLDGAGLLVLTDIAGGAPRFRLFTGPFRTGLQLPGPDKPIKYRDKSEWPTVDASSDGGVTFFGVFLADFQFDFFDKRTQVVHGTAGRAFRVRYDEFVDRWFLRPRFILRFTVNEQR